MNASTRKCTEAKRCHLINCYPCRRTLIDETATAMLLVPGTTQEDVDRYRYAAINALAFEIQTPAPKAPKAKAPAAVEPALIKGTLEILRACTTRGAAKHQLRALKVIELRAVSKALELGACSKLRRDELVEHLINFTVQMKLDHDAVLNAGRR